MTVYRIAVIPGDGIGQEVIPVGVKILQTVSKYFGFELKLEYKEWASCGWYLQHGDMMPPDWKEQLAGVDAIYYGAVGIPDKVPDHISLWGSILRFRREFDQYVNLRPVRLFQGMKSPLTGRKAGDIDYLIVRENTEGEYTSLGGTLYHGTDREIVVQESIFSRHGTDRILRYAYSLANQRKKQLTVATKSNGIAVSMPWWDKRADAIGREYPAVTAKKHHIDILSARFVLQPDKFDIVVATNLFGDILSDLGPATTGTIGITPSANLNPERHFPSLFEPVHGSAPDIASKGIANPIAMIWCGALMLDFLGNGKGPESAASKAIVKAIEKVLENGPHTRDIGGVATTSQVGEAVLNQLKLGHRL